MSRKWFILLLMSLATVHLLWSAPEYESGKRTSISHPAASSELSRNHLDDYVGTIDTAGTTYGIVQSCGRMIDVDNNDRISVVWTNSLSASGDPRYAFYNVWDPADRNFFDQIGMRIDASMRTGCVCQTTSPDGFCFPAFHQITSGYTFHSAAAIDFCACGGAFTAIEPTWCFNGGEMEVEIIGPKIDMDANGVLHVVSSENSGGSRDETGFYYSRGVPQFDGDGYGIDINWDDMGCGDFELWDMVRVSAYDVACSRTSQRCAVAWVHPLDNTPANGEIYLRISEDGGLNWNTPINVTRWAPWDSDCWDATHDITCNRDTFRACTDMSILLDESDFVHIAFTATPFYHYVPEDSGEYMSLNESMIYHWSEETDNATLVANGWYDTDDAQKLNVQNPCLALNPQTGVLLCSYKQYDTITHGESGFRMADACVTVSTDGGEHWAVGTNVTNTNPNPVVPGEGMHECNISLAPVATNNFLHMQYSLDKNGGGEELTLNPVIYQRIPIDEIATTPILPDYPMHWDGWSDAPLASVEAPQQFALHQNYPNPFNPTTTIQFDLLQQTNINLRVYNLLGQEIATLLNDQPLSAGVHKVSFNGFNFPSGVYIYRLEGTNFADSRKMVLLK